MMQKPPVAGQDAVRFNNTDWTSEAGLNGISKVIHLGNDDPQKLNLVSEQEIAIRELSKEELTEESRKGNTHGNLNKRRPELIESFGTVSAELSTGNLELTMHESGWVRMKGPQLRSGSVIPMAVQADIVSDPDVGLDVSELGFEHPRITKKVFEEYAPLLIAHTIGLIGRPLARGIDGFDARVTEKERELDVTIKTVPKHSPLLHPERQEKYLRAFHKLIGPMKGDPESLALLIPMDTFEAPAFKSLLSHMEQEGISLDRVRLLDGEILDPAGLVTSKGHTFSKPERIAYDGIGLFRIAAALEANPTFDDFVKGKDDGPFFGNFKIALDVAKQIRLSKNKAERLRGKVSEI